MVNYLNPIPINLLAYQSRANMAMDKDTAAGRVWCTSLKGLGLKVKQNQKSFSVSASPKGKSEKISGRFDDILFFSEG